MPVVELLVSAFLPVLLERLTSPELLQFLSQEGLYSKIKKWEETLKMILLVLGDAEDKQLKDRNVKMWLDNLQDLAYDVEDILDEFATEAFARKLKMEEQQASKLRKLLPACFSNWSLGAIKFNIRMRSNVKDVTSRFEQLCELRNKLELQVITGGASSSAAPLRPPTANHQIEPAVYGRDEDKKKILEMVLNDANFLVIPIVGMGGVGKTTLAQGVFNDSEVKSFEVKAWVCVSDGDFDYTRISMSILKNITGGSSSGQKDFDTVRKELKGIVNGKKFLLVLDDVWSINYGNSEMLQSDFKAGAPGSRIIVTTRLKEVALTITCRGWFHPLGILSNEDCWSVFSKCVFENNEAIPEHSDLESVRGKVIKMSNGLPLAAKTLGGLLCSKHPDEWLKTLNSTLWDLAENDESGIPAALKFSYYHLPSHLKRCFTYCAIFPKDYEFEEEELVFLWMAEGLVPQSTGNKHPEDFGGEYFYDLLSRSLFQQSSSDNSKFVMHDLVHDLAQWGFGEISLRLDNEMGANKKQRVLEKVRHFSYTVDRYDGKNKFEVFCEAVSLKARIRTFLAISQSQFGSSYITNMILFDMLPKLKTLRALSLRTYCIVELPNSIGSLKLLRYLNLAYTEIRSLPESTTSLYNLQSLLLTGCYELKKLPSNFRNLTNLRHLDIRRASSIAEMPVGLKELKSLQNLSDFIVGKNTGSTLKDLKSLEFLRGELCISRLNNVAVCDPFVLRDKKDLKELSLDWGSESDDSCNQVVEENVLDMLRPHMNLQKLTITCYGGTRFPHWVGDPSFSKMTVLRLEWCENCTSLPSFGLLSSLKVLTIKGMKKLKILGSEFYGVGCSKPFQSLETLYLGDLEELEHWETIKENEHVGTFPCLRELSIIRCPKLSGRLPDCLPSLEELVIKNCEQLVVSFSSLPMLYELAIDGCKEMTSSSPTDFKSLKSMTLEDISDFGNWFRQENFQKIECLKLKIMGCEQLMNLWKLNETFLEKPLQGLQSFISMTKLLIENCSNLVSFPEVCFLSNLSKLEIRNCNALTSLPKGMNHKNASLESLKMKDCNSLTFIVRGTLPSSLKKLKVEGCEKLEPLWDDNEESCTSVVDEENSINTTRSLLKYLQVKKCLSLNCLSSSGLLPETLQYLYVEDCNSLTFVVRGKLPSSLKKLEIKNCEKLESLWDDNEESCTAVVDEENHNNTNTSFLEYLHVKECPSLKCLSSSGLLPEMLRTLSLFSLPELESIAKTFLNSRSLEEINIMFCDNLKSIPEGLHNLIHLRKIAIYNCESIDCLGEEGPPNTNLSELAISNCKKLKALPNWFYTLNSLKSLKLSYCPSMMSFPEEGFPTNLTSLDISGLNVKMYKAVLKWGLHNLTSLTSLEIWGLPEAESFPHQELEMTFPPSLTHLNISSFPNLKCLMGEGFRNLNSLERLIIYDCPNLKSFPDLALLSSLKSLWIYDGPNFKSFSKLGLPSSLLELDIDDCPKLKEKYKRDKGKEWSKIFHIPYVKIDNRYIYDLEEEE